MGRNVYSEIYLTVALAAVVLLAAPAGGQVGVYPTGAQVRGAVGRGLAHLYRRQNPDGTWDSKYSRHFDGATEAMVVLAALSAGQDANGKPIRAAIEYLTRRDPTTVRARALRAMVLAELARPEFDKLLAGDVEWLIANQQPSGGWGYGPGHPQTRRRGDWVDCANSHLAVTALRDASAAGVKVRPEVWHKCRSFWSAAQNSDGGWGYEGPGGSGFRLRASSHGTTTAAALTACYALAEQWAAGGAKGRTGPPTGEVIAHGMKWMAENFDVEKIPLWVWGDSGDQLCFYHYHLAGLAQACGARRIGRHDWYRRLVSFLLARQRRDGGWCPAGKAGRKTGAVCTALAILALTNSARPVAINRLQGASARPGGFRDAANLTRWMSRKIGRPVTWQSVPLSALGGRVHEAPLLYIHLADWPRLPKTLTAGLRSFVADGGTVLVQTAKGDAASMRSARETFGRLFPHCLSRPLPAEHPVFNLPVKIAPVEIYGVGDACRTWVFLAAADLSGPWHRRDWRRSERAFQLGVNLILYAAGGAARAEKFRRRPPRPRPAAVLRSVCVARVRHAGLWRSAPRAFDRLSDVLGRAVSIAVRSRPAVDLTKDVPREIVLLWLTGSSAPALNGEKLNRLKRYLLAGGTLFADSAAGGREFTEGATKMLAAMFGIEKVQPIPADSPLLTGRFAGGIGSDVTKVRFTAALAKERGPAGGPALVGVELKGRIAVVLSGCGITCPMAGRACVGCRGLAGDDALRLAANVVLYAARNR